MATKRTLEEPTEVGPDSQKKVKAAGPDLNDEGVVETRVLIDNHEAGIIIGKGGSNVVRIRSEAKCFLSILKNDSGSKERVMSIKGTTDDTATAFKIIIDLLIEAATQRAKNLDETATGPDSHPIKLLIHKFLAGSVIGKGGAIIKEIMAETGCRIQLSNEPLPGSTEKTVTVSGPPDAAVAGLLRVMNQVRDNPLRSGSTSISYVPGAAMVAGNPYAGAYGAPPLQQQLYAPPAQAYGAAPGAYGAPPAQSYGLGAYGAAPAAGGASKTEKIVIPTVCTGTVIGKGGSIIKDIKAQSGTFISIADPEPTAPNDRVVSVTGTAQGIQTAIFLIRQRVESYQPPGVGVPGGHLGVPAPGY